MYLDSVDLANFYNTGLGHVVGALREGFRNEIAFTKMLKIKTKPNSSVHHAFSSGRVCLALGSLSAPLGCKLCKCQRFGIVFGVGKRSYAWCQTTNNNKY